MDEKTRALADAPLDPAHDAAEMRPADVLLLRVQNWIASGGELAHEDGPRVLDMLRTSGVKAEVFLETLGAHMARSARRSAGFLGMIEERLFDPRRLDTMEDEVLVRLHAVMQNKLKLSIDFLEKRAESLPARFLRQQEESTTRAAVAKTAAADASPQQRERMRRVALTLASFLERAIAEKDGPVVEGPVVDGA